MVKYTGKQIKEAFWKTFHKTGELWFSYLDEESAENCTTVIWEEFLENLGAKETNSSILINLVKKHLATLSKNERVEFIGSCMEDYCKLCGSEYLPCYCDPKYDE